MLFLNYHSKSKAANKRLKRDCQRVAFPVPLSRGGFGFCV
ncbi:death on curing protein, Doc toxin [Vibrio cholerae MS6]|nr:death on curing protein, Doc toxin [Vibrio cholerae MS6]